MGFTWVYVNPFHETGRSGSLYAVKDYFRLNPLLAAGDRRGADEILADFTRSARQHGLDVMMDLVINHTATDAPLVKQHPSWYRHEADGSLRSPRAVDPDDPSKVTVWGDLAELDYSERPERAEMMAFACKVVHHYARLGFRGFRCDAAYQIPGRVWEEVIAAARGVRPETVFVAETLGCTPDQVEQLAVAGFDYLFNSSKWWDFRAPWLLEQYEAFRRIAPSIGFPESHDTERLVCDLAAQGITDAVAVERAYRLRYLFAAFFSTGVMMPMGYEYGFRRKLDVVATRPADWEGPQFDLTAFITEVNALKARVPVLNEEGPQRRVGASDGGVVALLREGEDGAASVLGVLNADPVERGEVGAGELARAIRRRPVELFSTDGAASAAPLSMRVLGEASRSEGPVTRAPSSRSTLRDAEKVACGR